MLTFHALCCNLSPANPIQPEMLAARAFKLADAFVAELERVEARDLAEALAQDRTAAGGKTDGA